jgi:RNA polymerase sigma-70 factor (ECF subfamily)
MDGISLDLAGNMPPGASRTADDAEERGLVRRAQRGDRDAFDALVRHYDQEVLRLAMRVVRSEDEARDLYQEAFLKVYRSIGRFRLEAKFSTWLYRVVMNVCFDYLRRQKSRGATQPAESGDGESDWAESLPDERPSLHPDGVLRSREISRRLEQALSRLSERERMVFELKHGRGLKLKVIGEICGTSEEAAKNSLFRAIQKLRGDLGDLV